MKRKIKSIKLLIEKSDLDAVLISSVSNIIYLTDCYGFSYLQREAFLVIVAQPQGLKQKTPGVFSFLITDGRYSEAVADIPGFELIEISSSNSLEKVFENLSGKIKNIGFEENDLSVAEYKKVRKYFKTANLADLQNLRIIKDSFEIKSIEEACKIGDEAFDYILGKIKKGVTERELAFEIEFFIKKKGADISFPPIVAFGANSSIPHHNTSDRKLKTDNIILLDFGVKYQNYCSDMTRTIFFGKADDKFKKMYKTVLTAQQKTLNFLDKFLDKDTPWQPRARSILAKDVDRVARNYITEQGFLTIPHSLGHGIGIEVHEQPRLSPTSKVGLKSGMVFSIEPGIYIPGYGGVRIEDLVVLENKGARLLTHSPKHLIEI